MLTKSFSGDIQFILQRLKERNHFSFSKYADGEYSVLRNEPITNCDNWTFIPNIHQIEYQYLLSSYQYNHPDYFVGISCSCCQPQSHIQWMRENVGTKNVTWANLFVNSNYDFFKNEFFNEFNYWDGNVILVGNKNGMDSILPFKVDAYYPIETGGWLNPYMQIILNDMLDKAKEANNQLFLFSAGPLGNILAHRLHTINPNNTYLDIGSTINPWIVGNNRGYLRGNSKKVCIW